VPDEPDDLAPALPDARRERTVLSTRGRCLLAAGVATAACAVPLAERDLLRVGAFAAVLPLLALLLTLFTRRTVRAQRTLSPRRLPVGAAATVTLHVTGATAVGPLELVDTAPDAAGPAAPPRFVVPSSGTAVRYELRPVRRGVHRIGPLVAYGSDPLGLADFARTVPVDTARGGRPARSAGRPRRDRIGYSTERLLVLPRTVPLRGVPHALGSSDGAHGAGAAGSGKGRSDVLVRPYRSGDELRRVHWRSTARHDELMVRLEERPWRGGVTVLLDRRAGAHRGHGPGASLEWAVTFAASACVHLIDRGEPVELVTEDGASAVSAGAPSGADGVLDALATLRPSTRTGLDGPPLPGSGDVLAVLGAAAAEELPELLTRCPGQGHAVLLDVEAWGSGRSPVFSGADAPPVAATATALRAAGWAVTVAARRDRPEDVWDELVACPAPQAGV
jgi:uncharacterized protein (DUF58 family)